MCTRSRLALVGCLRVALVQVAVLMPSLIAYFSILSYMLNLVATISLIVQ